MIVHRAHIDPMSGFSNEPRLELWVSNVPTLNDLIFERRGPLYFAEKEGYVRFFYYNEPSHGYGGAEFLLNVKQSDGTIRQKTIYGPWSSNTGALLAAGFTPSVNVTLKDVQRNLPLAGHVTLELAREAIKTIPDAVIKFNKKFNWYTPTYQGLDKTNLDYYTLTS